MAGQSAWVLPAPALMGGQPSWKQSLPSSTMGSGGHGGACGVIACLLHVSASSEGTEHREPVWALVGSQPVPWEVWAAESSAQTQGAAFFFRRPVGPHLSLAYLDKIFPLTGVGKGLTGFRKEKFSIH